MSLKSCHLDVSRTTENPDSFLGMVLVNARTHKKIQKRHLTTLRRGRFRCPEVSRVVLALPPANLTGIPFAPHPQAIAPASTSFQVSYESRNTGAQRSSAFLSKARAFRDERHSPPHAATPPSRAEDTSPRDGGVAGSACPPATASFSERQGAL